jgi:predicted transposase YbfD/YdcC
VLGRLDPRALSRALLGPRRRRRRGGRPPGSVRKYPARRSAQQAKALARGGLRAVAVDGKTSRGARRADGTRVHLLGVAEHGGRLLDHLEVDVKHNETSHFTALLEPLDLAAAVVTFDALHTVRANLAWLTAEKKAHYIAVIKRNQPLLHARVQALPWRQVPAGATTREAGHGRSETRTLKACVAGLDLPGARQAIKVTRWRQDTATGKVSRETVYAITSLASSQATAADLARLMREHWTIEAHHHIRDVTFGEDAAISRTGHGPANLATIRAAITAAVKDAGYLHVPEGRRDHATPAEALRLHGLDQDTNGQSRNTPEPCLPARPRPIWTSGSPISCSGRPGVPSNRSCPRPGPRFPRRSQWARGCWRSWAGSRPRGRWPSWSMTCSGQLPAAAADEVEPPDPTARSLMRRSRRVRRRRSLSA